MVIKDRGLCLCAFAGAWYVLHNRSFIISRALGTQYILASHDIPSKDRYLNRVFPLFARIRKRAEVQGDTIFDLD